MRDEIITPFQKIINDANKEELEELKDLLEKEIRLSETAIKEGFEEE